MASIKQLDERRYKITVSNGYRPNGKKISKAKTIQVPSGVPKRGIGQYVAHAAEELECSFKTGYAEDGEMTFEEFASRWLKRQTKYAPSTIAAYRRMLEVVYPMIGGIRLNKLRPMALENMLSELRKRKHHGKRINESTAQRYLSVVSAVLSDAKRNEIIEKNPARMLDLPTPQRTVQRIPTRGEAEKLLDALAKEPRHYRLFYLLSMYTGCRRGELCALQWSDFTGTQNGLLLTVSRSRSSVPSKGIVEGSTKNGKSREVYLSSDLRGMNSRNDYRHFIIIRVARFIHRQRYVKCICILCIEIMAVIELPIMGRFVNCCCNKYRCVFRQILRMYDCDMIITAINIISIFRRAEHIDCGCILLEHLDLVADICRNAF